MKLLSKNTGKSGAGVLIASEAVQTVPATQPATEPEGKKKRRRPRKKRSKKWIILLLVLVVAAVLIINVVRGFRNNRIDPNSLYTYVEAEIRPITALLSGNGTLEPADSYTVTTLISGDILAADFEEGNVVAKGDVLYELDSSSAATNIERSELALSQSQRNYNRRASSWADLTVTASIGGTISGLTARAGETAGTQMPIAIIENTDILKLTEYYSDEYADRIYKGMSATISIPDQMMNLYGTVSEVSSIKRVSETGISCFAVTVQLENSGSLNVGMTATCWLTGDADGDIFPSISDDDGLDSFARTTVYADVTGTVAEVRVRNNEKVTAGQVILTLSSDTLGDDILSAADSLRDTELALKSQYDALDNYTIEAPIHGTIVDKYYKEGETSESGRPLCIIYDLSYLSFVMHVDELDINQVSVGQKAVITADAVPDKEYEGTITKVGINGTSSGGVTTYPVTVRIDKTEGLLPGMNVDVYIAVAKKDNAVAVPADAVERGNRVLVKTRDGSTGEGAPTGYAYVDVVTGISDDDYVEIISGISSGESVAYIPNVAIGSGIFGGMMMGGGMQGGGTVVTRVG